MNSYIKAIAVVSVLMLVVTGFIMLGVLLQNLTAEEIESAYPPRLSEPAPSIFQLGDDEQIEAPAYIPDIFYRFQGIYLDVRQLEDLDDLQTFIYRVKLRDINAVRITIKRDDGVIPFRIGGRFVPLAGEDNETDLRIQDIIEMLHDNGLYVSGKIACFRDNRKSTHFPTWALTETATGGRFSDAGDSSWLNIYSEDARAYIKDLVAESVLLGFDEIILDYFHLPNVSDISRIVYNDGGVSKSDAVRNFVTEVRAVIDENMPDYKNVRLGLNFQIHHLLNTGNIAPGNAMGINIDELIDLSDFFTTSFAPDRLPEGALGITNPAGNPYETVRALGERFADISGRIIFRPDLQALGSTDEQILSQRQALAGTGISVWTLINYDNNY